MDSETDQNQDVSETLETKKSKFDPNTVWGTFKVALAMCIICSLVVSTAAVKLRPMQQKNAENKQKRNVLIAAGLWDEDEHTDGNIPELFKDIETVAVNLPGRSDDDPEAGTLDTAIDIKTYNQRKAPKKPDQGIMIGDQDVAGITRREKISLVYLVKNDSGELQSIVLPIYGKGLWSTLYGYLALDADARTVKGITFYEHKETPGLGGEVDNSKWKSQWPGKIVVDESGSPVVEVTKPGNASQDYQVDGLSGATITSNGVEKAVRYWLGSDAFGPYLDQFRSDEIATTEE